MLAWPGGERKSEISEFRGEPPSAIAWLKAWLALSAY